MARVTGRPLVNATRDRVLAGTVEVADTFLSRLVGLLGRRSLAEGRALVLTHTRSIHMVCMRFCIDVVFTDETGRVVCLAPRVPPFALRLGGPDARVAVELPAGLIEASGTRVGDRLVW